MQNHYTSFVVCLGRLGEIHSNVLKIETYDYDLEIFPPYNPGTQELVKKGLGCNSKVPILKIMVSKKVCHNQTRNH